MNDSEIYRNQLAAYFAGQLSAQGAAALESALARDEALAREAEALRPLAEELAEAVSNSSQLFRLSPDRLAVIRAAASGHIVEFPRAIAPAASSARRDVSWPRRFAPALAAAIAVVIGAVTGFTSGSAGRDAGLAPWQVATQLADSISPGGDPVYFYPPAYSVNRHVPWPSRRGAEIGLASALPTLGLPGPRSAYLIRGNDFLLQ